jgi:hypothetical protein
VNEAVATAQGRYLALIVVNTDYLVTDLRETDGCHEPHVSRADNCYPASIFHPLLLGASPTNSYVFAL